MFSFQQLLNGFGSPVIIIVIGDSIRSLLQTLRRIAHGDTDTHMAEYGAIIFTVAKISGLFCIYAKFLAYALNAKILICLAASDFKASRTSFRCGNRKLTKNISHPPACVFIETEPARLDDTCRILHYLFFKILNNNTKILQNPITMIPGPRMRSELLLIIPRRDILMPVLVNFKGSAISGRLNQSENRTSIHCVLPQYGPITKIPFLCTIGAHDPLTPCKCIFQNLRPHFPWSACNRKNMNAFPGSFIKNTQKPGSKRFVILLKCGPIKIHGDQFDFSRHVQIRIYHKV